jgi:hypothetical protein
MSVSAAPNCIGAAECECSVQPSNGVRNWFVRSDQREQISESRRWLPDLGSLRLDRGQRVLEDGQGLATRKRSRRGEDRVEASSTRRLGNRLGDRVIVAYEVGFVDADVGTNGLVGQVEHFEHDVDAADSTPELERLDAFVDEVSKQLRPGRLLLTRCIPDARLSGAVVAAGASCGIGARGERASGGTLVPEMTGDLPARCGGNRVSDVHT